MWPFRPRTASPGIQANSVVIEDGIARIDVRGQTCPGYLLAINKAVEALEPATEAHLLITYPPCGDDVRAWCREKGVAFLELRQEPAQWVIRIRKP